MLHIAIVNLPRFFGQCGKPYGLAQATHIALVAQLALIAWVAYVNRARPGKTWEKYRKSWEMHRKRVEMHRKVREK